MSNEKRKEFIKNLFYEEMDICEWGEFRNYNPFTLTADVFDFEEEETYSVGVRKIEKVIDEICHNPEFEVDEELETNVMKANKYLETGYLTTTDVDSIFQLAIFNEVKI